MRDLERRKPIRTPKARATIIPPTPAINTVHHGTFLSFISFYLQTTFLEYIYITINNYTFIFIELFEILLEGVGFLVSQLLP